MEGILSVDMKSNSEHFEFFLNQAKECAIREKVKPKGGLVKVYSLHASTFMWIAFDPKSWEVSIAKVLSLSYVNGAMMVSPFILTKDPHQVFNEWINATTLDVMNDSLRVLLEHHLHSNDYEEISRGLTTPAPQNDPQLAGVFAAHAVKLSKNKKFIKSLVIVDAKG